MKENANTQQKFKTRITAEHRLFDLHIRETLSYRDLIGLLVKRDFVAKYKQTILGPLWFIVQPVTIYLVVVLARIVKERRKEKKDRTNWKELAKI